MEQWKNGDTRRMKNRASFEFHIIRANRPLPENLYFNNN